MRMDIRLGRIAGIAVGINWSVLVIFALIAWGLAGAELPNAYPHDPAWAHVVAGLGAAFVFFGGLLAHELSHAVVARRNGVEVEDITLWLFGGVARLRGEAPNPGAELRIAGVGPLVSLVLALVFGAIAAGIGRGSGTGLVFGTFAWLAGINLMLAVFNVIPAAPLDGGRLLRAWLWRRRGDRISAAITAARAGRVLGGILIAVGLFELFATSIGFGGLWLAVLGWFLVRAASAEEQQARVTGLLSGVRVRDVMSRQPYSAPADVSVADFLEQYMFRYRFSTFPLLSGDRLAGLVTMSRIKSVDPQRRTEVRLSDIACPPDEVPQARPDELLTDVLERLDGCSDGRALVLSDGALVGIVSPSDISRALQHASLLRGGV